MTAELENESHSLSETTRKVFLTFSINSPSALFSPTIITAKGLYPPSLVSIKNLSIPPMAFPRRSFSVPIKLITMPAKQDSPPPTPPLPPKMKLTVSTPTVSTSVITLTPSVSTPIASPAVDPLPPLKKPTLIDKLITSATTIKKSVSATTTTTTVRKAPRPSTSTRTASAAPVQIKTSTSIKLVHKAKKKDETKSDDEEEDIPVTKPISLTEKRKRQAKRADQVKIWKVREEREAREARSLIRRKIMSGVTKKVNETITIIRTKKKRVKFDFDKNKIIQLPNDDQQQQ